MASRTTTKARAAKTVVTPIIEDTPVTADVSEEQSLFERARVAVDQWMQSTARPTWMRTAVASLLGLIAAGSAYFFGAQWLTSLVLWTASLTGSAFVTFLVAFIGTILVVMSTYTCGMWVFEQARAFDMRTMKSRISGFFGGKENAHA